MKAFDIWIDTWAPHCGSSRAVFVGHFKALMRAIDHEICRRAEKIYKEAPPYEDLVTAEKARYIAMGEVFREIQEMESSPSIKRRER